MNKRCFLVLGLIFILLSGMNAVLGQTDDFGVWLEGKAEKEMGKWSLECEGELRSMENTRELERIGIRLGADYQVGKYIKTGFSYQFLYLFDEERENVGPRHRLSLYSQGKYKWGDFSLSLRERVQETFKDESERSYKMNPKWSWRNKLEFSYNIPSFPVSPGISFESFYQLNNPDGNRFDGLRYGLSGEFSPVKHQKMEVSFLIDKEMNVKDPVRRFVIGLGYVISF